MDGEGTFPADTSAFFRALYGAARFSRVLTALRRPSRYTTIRVNHRRAEKGDPHVPFRSRQRRRWLGLLPFQLLNLAQDNIALERREVIDEQDPVEMVDLVLHDTGMKIRGFAFDRLSVG